MGEISQVFKSETIEFAGRKLLLKRPSFDVERIFENWLEEKALEKIVRRRHLMGEEVFRQAMSAWEKDCAAGEYAYSSSAGDKSYRSNEGFKKLIFFMLCESNKEPGAITDELFDKLFAEKELDLVMAWNRLNSATPTMPPPVEGASD